MLLAIVADTHLPRGSRTLPQACVERLRSADLILHAGDFVTRSVFDELTAIGPPVAAVHGNVDATELCALLPAQRIVEAGGFQIFNPGSPTDRRRRSTRLSDPAEAGHCARFQRSSSGSRSAG